MNRKLAAPALIATLLVGGCLPSRDNANDPQIAPVVHARVVELAHRAPCPAGLPATTVEIVTATRLDCLAIDARDTVDPQGTTAFTYAFFLSSAMTPFATNSSGLAVLDQSYLSVLPPLVETKFRVRASDSGGAHSEATIALHLDDLAPIAAVKAPRSVPLGGLPGQVGTTTSAFFDGTASTDPDDTAALLYCWSFDGAPEICSLDPHDPAFTRPINLLAHRRTAGTLRVKDRWGAVSLRTTTTLDVTSPNIWMSLGNFSTPEIARLDNGAIPTLGRGPASAAFVGTSMIFVGASTSGKLQEYDWLTSLPLSPGVDFGGPNSGVGVQYDAAHDELLTVADFTTLPPEFRSWTHNGGLVPSAPVVLPGAAKSFSTSGFPRIQVDARGDAWIVAQGYSSLLWHVRDPASANPTVDDIGVPAGRVITGLDVRPESDEIWGVETRDYAHPPTGAESPARVIRYHPAADGTVVVDAPIDLPFDIASSLSWVNAEEFWIYLAGDGVRLVDGDVLAINGIDAATRALIPLNDVARLVVDPLSGDCWAFPSSGDATIISRSGRSRTVPSVSNDAIGFDPDGAVFFYLGGQFVYRGFAPGTITVVDRHYPGLGNARFDPASGGAWAVGSTPPSLLHFGIDGSIDQTDTRVTITELDGSTTTRPLNYLLPIYVSRDGTSGYGFERDASQLPNGYLGLLRLDLTTNPVRATRVLDDTSAPAFAPYFTGNAGFGGFESLDLATPPGGTPFFWSFRDTTKRYAVLGTNGAPGSGYTLLAAEGGKVPSAKATDISGSVCIGTVDNVTPTQTARLRAVSKTGTVTLLQSFPVPLTTIASGYVQGVSSTSQGARDICFIAFSCLPNLDANCFNNFVQAQIAEYDVAGNQVHPTIAVSGDWYVNDVKAVGADDVWTSETNYRQSTRRLVHYTWNGLGWVPIPFTNTYSGAAIFLR